MSRYLLGLSISKLSLNQSGSDAESYNGDGRCPDCRGNGTKPQKPKKTLKQLAEETVFKEISKSVAEDSFRSRYCCGGTLPTAPKSEPITLRWDDPSDDDLSRRCDFPMDGKLVKEKVTSIVNGICNACDKNGNIDANSFSSNFDPHGAGILDIVSQILLPGFQAQKLKERPEHRGIKATLTKLQVLSAGSAAASKLLSASSARSEFGRLIICLPHTHEGGRIEISRNGRSTKFDWSDSHGRLKRKNKVKWAAFIGGCTYRIYPVVEGKQFMLIYTLIVTQCIGGILDAQPIIELSSLPLYQSFKIMLEQPSFMRRVLPLFDLTKLDKADEKLFEKEAALCEADPENHIAIDYDNWQCATCHGGFPTVEEYREARKQEAQISRIGSELHPLYTGEKKNKEYRMNVRGGIDYREWQRPYVEEDLQEDWPWTKHRNVRWLNEPLPVEEGVRELALLNPIEGVEEDDELYHGKGKMIEKFYSHLVILAHIQEPSERNLKR
ncbi:hypothetical protein N431DRAFT_544234 [Stipitochalara longipes BDJ]|nr:hypothetical protein N431DRAFT_544234 [Stipitochalara longipes BDJ]